MKYLLVLAVILLSCACTTLKPTEASPAELQRMITSENLFEPGDRVRLVTADGAVHKFRVRELDLEQGLVIGKADTVPVADIVAVETREVSVGKTAVLTGGLVGAWALLIYLAAPAVALSAAM
jgi:hypothetical protein